MIYHCNVCAELFWPAIAHCKLPVYLGNNTYADLRFFTDMQKEMVLPHGQGICHQLEVQFSDNQDYIRFVLAYLIAEGAHT